MTAHSLHYSSETLDKRILAKQALSVLTEREREIVAARLGLCEPEQTLAEVGEMLGITGSRVRQIEQRAYRKMRSALTPKATDALLCLRIAFAA